MGAAGSISTQFIKLTWKNTDLLNALEHGDIKVNQAVMAYLEMKAPQVENHMKTNAPWRDQTGNARQGLRAEAYDLGGDQMGIILYGQVPYQIWLELKNSGELAIILPTIEIMGPEVMSGLENIMERVNF